MTSEKIALVARDYTQVNADGTWDLSPHYHQILQACDQAGCTTVLFAPYTWELRGNPEPKPLFEALRSVKRVVLEVDWLPVAPAISRKRPQPNSPQVQVWMKGADVVCFRQQFATTGASDDERRAFMAALPKRIFGQAAVVICGETTIVTGKKGNLIDDYRFREMITKSGIKLILNPIHDYMTPFMNVKREYYSQAPCVMASVWNRGRATFSTKKLREPRRPWIVYANGKNCNGSIGVLGFLTPDRPDIQIATLDLSVI